MRGAQSYGPSTTVNFDSRRWALFRRHFRVPSYSLVASETPMHHKKMFFGFLVLSLTVSTDAAQSQEKVPDSNLVSKSVTAVGYKVGGGSTQVDLKGTDLMPQAIGEAKVKAKTGATNIEVSLKNMTAPSELGAEFLTYVLWVVTPDGRTGNTGELIIPGETIPGTYKLTVTAEDIAHNIGTQEVQIEILP